MDRLSPRQQQVARLLSQGMADKEIARTLGISIHTVRWHLREAKVRTGTSRITLAVNVAVDRMHNR